MKRSLLQTLIRFALTLIAGIVAGFLLLLAVYALPVEPMEANVRASVPALNGEWRKEESYDQLVAGYITTQLDNSTDAAMLLAAVNKSDKSLTAQVADSERANSSGNAFLTLMAYGENSEELSTASIARYWHGYLVFLKPLLLFLSYLDIRMLLMLVQGALLCAVIAGMCRRGLMSLLPAFLIGMIFITPSIAGFSLQFSTALFTALAAMIALLYLPKHSFDLSGCCMLFLLTGMTTSYVDYLTYPVATFGLPFVICLYLYPQKNWKDEITRLILCGICWCAGYFGMWAGKWVIAGMFGSDPWFWPNLFAKIGQRSSSSAAEITFGYADVVKSVFRPFCKRTYLLAAVFVCVAWLWRYIRSLRLPSDRGWQARRLMLVLVALIPFAWFFCTKNHTYVHAFFTSRSLCVSGFAIAAFFGSFIHQPEAKN